MKFTLSTVNQAKPLSVSYQIDSGMEFPLEVRMVSEFRNQYLIGQKRESDVVLN